MSLKRPHGAWVLPPWFLRPFHPSPHPPDHPSVQPLEALTGSAVKVEEISADDDSEEEVDEVEDEVDKEVLSEVLSEVLPEVLSTEFSLVLPTPLTPKVVNTVLTSVRVSKTTETPHTEADGIDVAIPEFPTTVEPGDWVEASVGAGVYPIAPGILVLIQEHADETWRGELSQLTMFEGNEVSVEGEVV